MRVEKPEQAWLEDPRVFAVNREEAHSDHKYFTSLSSARQSGKMLLKQSLNGRWKFCYTENPAQRPADFYRNDFDCSGWNSITVPGHIQMQGFGAPQYVNVEYPWDGREEVQPPHVPKNFNPVGSYVRRFTLNPELKGKRVFLSFQGFETALYVWVNGTFVGYSEDGYTPAEFEITPFLREGENCVAAEVYHYSSASWIQDQDFWRFSGLFRSVNLYAVPRAHVRDLRVTTELRNRYEQAQVSLELQLMLAAENAFADVEMRDAGGNVVASILRAECAEKMSLSFPLRSPHLWSAEDPYLYRLVVHLYGADGKTLEAAIQDVGVREFRMIDGLMCLNGKRVVFRGVNRHEFNCRRGRAVTDEDMMWDICFLKRHNINAVRTSHYPNRSLWYRLCDRYGIYLIDEANLESHGTWAKQGAAGAIPGDREEWLGAVLDRAKSMLQRDKNHPSVLIWSCGNESFGGRDLFEVSQYFHRTDPTRLVHYEGIVHDRRWDATSDMESRMYAKPEEIRAYLQDNPPKPYISCEYMHAMGNSCGGMNLYTELEEEFPAYQGGFLWDYIDQALVRKKPYGEEVLAYGGDFGDRPNDGAFCGDGIVFADRTPSPKTQEVKYLYQSVRLIPDKNGVLVRNRNLFISTDDCRLCYKLLYNGHTMVSDQLDCIVPPGAQRYLRLELPETARPGEYTLACSLCRRELCSWAEAGYEQAYGQCVWSVGDSSAPKGPQLRTLHINRGEWNIGFSGKTYSALFSLEGSGLVSLCRRGEEMLCFAPRPVYWRAPTDNDRGNGYPMRCALWYAAGRMQKCTGAEVTENNGRLTVAYSYELPQPIGVTVRIVCTAAPGEPVVIRAEYPGGAGLPELPLFGVEFCIKGKYHQFRYYGLGPDENYIDRRCGARLGIFEGDAKKNLTPYLVPQECGNRTGVRWAQVTEDNGRGLRFTGESGPFELSVLPYTAYELDNASHIEELPKPDKTVVRIAACQMGVGGDDSWGAPVHEEYRIPSDRPISFSFSVHFCD